MKGIYNHLFQANILAYEDGLGKSIYSSQDRLSVERESNQVPAKCEAEELTTR
jgi:hypothetical protein